MKAIQHLLALADITIKDAWRRISENGYKILFIVDSQNSLLGSVTDGDVRRWILEDRSITDPVTSVMCADPIVAGEEESKEEIKRRLLNRRVECVPIINKRRQISEVIFWDNLFNDDPVVVADVLDIPVVIMAGGLGKRLDPFTKILPKPLMPIGDKPIIEIIMEQFAQYGVDRFFVSLNYKSNMIKAYFQDCAFDYDIQYLNEERPLGTAGSLSLLRGKIDSTFIVSNADILVEANYANIMKFHKDSGNKITLVCSMKHIPVPYGVVDIGTGGVLKGIREKPEFDYLVMTGIYVLEPELIDKVPGDREYHITHLIDDLRAKNEKIGVYPVSEKAWMDIGEFKAYEGTLERFQRLS